MRFTYTLTVHITLGVEVRDAETRALADEQAFAKIRDFVSSMDKTHLVECDMSLVNVIEEKEPSHES